MSMPRSILRYRFVLPMLFVFWVGCSPQPNTNPGMTGGGASGGNPALAASPPLESAPSNWAKKKPNLDGTINPSEWDDANKIPLAMGMYDMGGQSNGANPFTIYLKNDQTHLYLAGKLEGEELDGSMSGMDFNSLVMDTFTILFDNNNDGSVSAGEDKKSLYMINGVPYVKDQRQLSKAEQEQGVEEDSEPQDTKGTIIHTGSAGGTFSFELAIPLASGDKHDINVKPGQKLKWNIIYFDKFNLSLTGMLMGGISGFEGENALEWGTLVLATKDSKPAPAVVAKAPSLDPPMTTGPALPPNRSKGDIKILAQILNESEMTDESLKFIGSHSDMILVAFPYKHVVDKLRRENPNATILLFNNPYFAFGDEFWDVGSMQEMDQVSEVYSLKTGEDRTINYGGPVYEGMEVEQKLALMDITNPKWQDYFTSQTRKHVDKAGFDGVFIDTLTEDIPPFALGPGNKFPKGYSAKKWKEANYQFLRKMKQAFAGSNAKIIFNGITRAPGKSGPLPNVGMMDIADGTTIEAFSIYKSMDSSRQAKQWYFEKTILKDLKYAADRGKWVVIEVYGNSDDDQIRLYALCSFLMVQTDKTFFYFTRKDQAGALHWRPEWSVTLGNPKGSYQKGSQGSYHREFEKGRVFVNPTNKNITLQVPGGFKDLHNRAVTQVNLPAYSGAILTAQ